MHSSLISMFVYTILCLLNVCLQLCYFHMTSVLCFVSYFTKHSFTRQSTYSIHWLIGAGLILISVSESLMSHWRICNFGSFFFVILGFYICVGFCHVLPKQEIVWLSRLSIWKPWQSIVLLSCFELMMPKYSPVRYTILTLEQPVPEDKKVQRNAF